MAREGGVPSGLVGFAAGGPLAGIRPRSGGAFFRGRPVEGELCVCLGRNRSANLFTELISAQAAFISECDHRSCQLVGGGWWPCPRCFSLVYIYVCMKLIQEHTCVRRSQLGFGLFLGGLFRLAVCYLLYFESTFVSVVLFRGVCVCVCVNGSCFWVWVCSLLC